MYYVYEVETKKVVAEVESFKDIEFNYDWEIYGATQSPAFGCIDGLIEQQFEG